MTSQGVLLVVLLCHFLVSQSKQCLQQDEGRQLPDFGDMTGNGAPIYRHHQAIIPTYKFESRGNITEWGVDVHPSNDETYALHLQVWRPSPTVDDSTGTGIYHLVGDNRFSSISISGGVVRVTPAVGDRVQFSSGDVLGFYLANAKNADRRVIAATEDTFTSHTVWHASVAPPNENTVFSAGSSGTLNTLLNGAPVLSIQTEVIACPQSTSSTLPPQLSPSTTSAAIRPISVTTMRHPMPSVPAASADDDSGENTISPSTRHSAPTGTVYVGSNPDTASIATSMSYARMSLMPTISATLSSNSKFVTASPGHESSPVQLIITTNSVDITSISSGPVLVPVLLVPVLLVIIGIIVAIVLTSLIMFVIFKFFVPSKRRSKAPDATHNNIPMNTIKITNGTTAHRHPVTNAIYDYVDDGELVMESHYREISSVPASQGRMDKASPALLYNTNGPSTGKPPAAGAVNLKGAHIYEFDVNSVQETKTSQTRQEYQIYDDPNLTEVSKLEASGYEVPVTLKENQFENAGTHVPSSAERKKWKGRTRGKYSMGYSNLKFFLEEPTYWTPASTTSDLYSQLASKKYREIQRNQLTILEEIGSGAFGEVCKAIWTISGATKELAVKTLREELPEEDKVRFLQEAAIMGQFSHPNVVKLYGVITVGEPVMICSELMSNGDLRDYLCFVTIDKKNQRDLEKRLLRFSKQVAAGMKYLANKSFVHRDLAARNVFLDDRLNCKIGDFGSARDLVHETYYTSKRCGGKIPVKWTAPEALLYKKYSTDSDVWSYGMVLFEIWSVGKKPFTQMSNVDVLRIVNTGYNQPPPPGCPRAIYQLMVNCWHPTHSSRPSFSVICSYLSSSTDLLLQWVEVAESISPRSRQLGAPLSEGETLYKDLQNTYADFQN